MPQFNYPTIKKRRNQKPNRPLLSVTDLLDREEATNAPPNSTMPSHTPLEKHKLSAYNTSSMFSCLHLDSLAKLR